MRHEIVLGDYVRTTTHGHEGRVHGVHPSGCPENREWFSGQRPPLPESYWSERWISVLVNGGGSVTVPASLATRIDPIEGYHNPWADEYWRD